jgi:hypothetical protein
VAEHVVGVLGDYTTENSQMKLQLILVTLAAAAVTALTVGTAKAAPGAGTGASFVVECAINGVFVADPIALTRHEHVETGARPFENSITADSVRNNETSCFDAGDKTAYWSPLLYENSGTALVPIKSDTYYRGGVAPSEVVAFPYSTQMLVNVASRVNWECRAGGTVEGFADAPSSCAGRLIAAIQFPWCWNGDSPANIDDFQYPSAGSCAAPYDRVIPEMTQRWSFIARDGEINGVKVSAGDGQLEDQSFEHSDFLNGWDQDRLSFLIEDCIRGVPLSGTRPDRCRLIDPAKLRA